MTRAHLKDLFGTSEALLMAEKILRRLEMGRLLRLTLDPLLITDQARPRQV